MDKLSQGRNSEKDLSKNEQQVKRKPWKYLEDYVFCNHAIPKSSDQIQFVTIQALGQSRMSDLVRIQTWVVTLWACGVFCGACDLVWPCTRSQAKCQKSDARKQTCVISVVMCKDAKRVCCHWPIHLLDPQGKASLHIGVGFACYLATWTLGKWDPCWRSNGNIIHSYIVPCSICSVCSVCSEGLVLHSTL